MSLGTTPIRSWWWRLSDIAAATDTTTIRLILAWASFAWAVALSVDINAFERRPFALMRAFGNEYVWIAGFFLHWVGVHWRLIDRRSRPMWALFVNAFGFLLWFVSTAALNFSIGFFSQSLCLEVTMVAASGWALYRTGLQPEIVTP